MNLPASVTRNFARSALTFKKQSPHIFFAAGIVGVVASTVLACRATLKLSETLDDIKDDVRNVNNLKEIEESADRLPLEIEGTGYTDIQYKKDLAYVYLMGGVEIVKLYGPAVIIGTISIAALTGSHVQLTRRNASLMAAYAAVQKAYEEYRSRVRQELGDERELEIHRAIETKEVDGEEVKVVDPNKRSPYSVFFDEYSKYWEKDPELNKLYLQCQQNYANNLLRARGHLFLNEVYDMLGVDRSKAGAVVGWVIGETGDNFVDFGIFEACNSRFVNGFERSIILDFNVDGVIYDKI